MCKVRMLLMLVAGSTLQSAAADEPRPIKAYVRIIATERAKIFLDGKLVGIGAGPHHLATAPLADGEVAKLSLKIESVKGKEIERRTIEKSVGQGEELYLDFTRPEGKEEVKRYSDSKNSNTWNEYRMVADGLSMDNGSITFGTRGGPAFAFMKQARPDEQRLRAAVESRERTKVKFEEASRTATGLKMFDKGNEKELEEYTANLAKLSGSYIKGVGGNDSAKADTIVAAVKMFASLHQNGARGAEMASAARQLDRQHWGLISPIFMKNSGPVTASPPLAFRVIMGPGRERAVQVTNVSGKNLTNATVLVASAFTSFPPHEPPTFYLFVPSLKSKESLYLSRNTVSALVDATAPGVVRNAMIYSIWCNELSCEKTALDFGRARPSNMGGVPALPLTISKP